MDFKINEKKIVGSLRIADINQFIAYKGTLTIKKELYEKSEHLQRLVQQRKVFIVGTAEIQRIQESYINSKVSQLTKLTVKEATQKLEGVSDKKVLQKLLETDSRKTLQSVVKEKLKTLADSKNLEEI